MIDGNFPVHVDRFFFHEKELKLLCIEKTCHNKWRRTFCCNSGVILMSEIGCPMLSNLTQRVLSIYFRLLKIYVEEQPKSSVVLLDPTITERAKKLALLQKRSYGRRKWNMKWNQNGKKSSGDWKKKVLKLYQCWSLDNWKKRPIWKKLRNLVCRK